MLIHGINNFKSLTWNKHTTREVGMLSGICKQYLIHTKPTFFLVSVSLSGGFPYTSCLFDGCLKKMEVMGNLPNDKGSNNSHFFLVNREGVD